MPDTLLPTSHWHSYSSVAPFSDRGNIIKPLATTPLSADRSDANNPQTLHTHAVPSTKARQKTQGNNNTSAADWPFPPTAPSPLLPFARSPQSLPPPNRADMSGAPPAKPSNEARPAKVNTSTNNLFSSSCQPMRNTPNGESFAKVHPLPHYTTPPCVGL